MWEALEWDHRRALWKGQNNRESQRRSCVGGGRSQFQPCFFFFFFFSLSLYSLRSAWPQSLRLSFLPIFPIINSFFNISAKRRRTHTHARSLKRRRRGVTFDLISAIVCEFNERHGFWENALEHLDWTLEAAAGYWMWLYRARKQSWLLQIKEGMGR